MRTPFNECAFSFFSMHPRFRARVLVIERTSAKSARHQNAVILSEVRRAFAPNAVEGLAVAFFFLDLSGTHTPR
jgi:hypothetical protein